VLVIAGHRHERDDRDEVLGADEEAGLVVRVRRAPIVRVRTVELDVAALEDDVRAFGEDVAGDHLVHRAAGAAVAVEDHVEARPRRRAGAEVERAVDAVAGDGVLVLGPLGQRRQRGLVIAVARAVGATVDGGGGEDRGRPLHAVAHRRAVGIGGGAPVDDHLVRGRPARNDRTIVDRRSRVCDRGGESHQSDRDYRQLRTHAGLYSNECALVCAAYTSPGTTDKSANPV